MRIGIISYPMLFQRIGGLQIQIQMTIAALSRLNIDATLVDTINQKLSEFDIIHVFGTAPGNCQIIEEAKSQDCRVVLSPLVSKKRSRIHDARERVVSNLVGPLTAWSLKTSFYDRKKAIELADHVVVLGKAERNAVEELLGADNNRVSIISNGVAPHFFTPDTSLIDESENLDQPFLLQVASIGPYKNQLAVSRAARNLGRRVLFIGPCAPAQEGYLTKVLQEADGNARYGGVISNNDPTLPAIYAAADVFVLPSLSEVMPISVMESLAAGTPVVLTKHNQHDLEASPGILETVDPESPKKLMEAIRRCSAQRKPRDIVADTVRPFTWDRVAKQLNQVYKTVVS